ncbi:MAG: thioredoxin family protein [Burkholderiaceae bacterium]
MDSVPDAAPPACPTIVVACLCADWCRVCDSYRETFAALRAQYQDRPVYRFLWVDIEDDAELLGDLEVETFPTLLIGAGERLRFVGPVPPQLAAAQRLLESASQAPVAAGNPAAQALLQRLQQSCC